MRILITGATGLIGKTLCQVLSGEGNELVILSRRGASAQVIPNARTFRWNPEAELPPAEAWEGVEAVIHLDVAGTLLGRGQIGEGFMVDGVRAERVAGRGDGRQRTAEGAILTRPETRLGPRREHR